MPFLSRNQIDPAVRAKFEAARKVQLRQAMLDPALSQQQVQRLRAEIQQLGTAKVYGKVKP